MRRLLLNLSWSKTAGNIYCASLNDLRCSNGYICSQLDLFLYTRASSCVIILVDLTAEDAFLLAVHPDNTAHLQRTLTTKYEFNDLGYSSTLLGWAVTRPPVNSVQSLQFKLSYESLVKALL